MNILTLREFYFSQLQQPYLLWLSLMPGVYLLLTRRAGNSHNQIKIWTWILVITSFFDAWFTAEHLVFLNFRWSPSVSSLVSFFFVTWGDLRILWTSDLLKKKSLDFTQKRSTQAFLLSFLICLIVPIFSGVIYRWGFQEKEGGLRWLFLVYEILFLVLIFLWNQWKSIQPKGLFYLVITYYSLWILADGILLHFQEQSNLGWFLRIFANVLYYGGVPYQVAKLNTQKFGFRHNQL